MTVTVTKPAFNLRESLTSLRRKIGLKGAEVMSAETVDDVYNIIGTNRNLLINGAFNVSQRGTSWTNVYGYTADRWQVARYAGSINSVSVEAVSGVIGDPSLKKCLRVGYNNGGAGALFMNQPIDKYTSAAMCGKTVTLSFYVRSNSIASGRLQQAAICYHTGSGVEEGMYYFNFKTQSTTNIRKYFTPTEDWQRVEFSGTLPSNVEQVGVGLIDSDYRDSGYLEFTGIQLEIGATATPFEHRPYATELALCQRYYQQWGGNTANERIGGGFNYSATQVRVCMPLVVTMRSSPTLTFSSASDWAIEGNGVFIGCTAINVDQPSPRVAAINFDVASGLTSGQGVQVCANSTTNARLKLSAEL